jgi:hypothetical protein
MNSIPCSLCNEGGHPSHKCPMLVSPLKEGFFQPPGGRPASGDDDDDEKLNGCVVELKASRYQCLKLHSNSVTVAAIV